MLLNKLQKRFKNILAYTSCTANEIIKLEKLSDYHRIRTL